MHTRSWISIGALVALLLGGCGEQDDDDGAGAPDAPDGEPAAPEHPDEGEPFDRDRAREQAESFLGVAEDEIEESAMARIVRRDDEEFPATMDLRPGRLNLELDEDAGEHRVTRVTVEVPDGEDELVVE